MAQGTGRSTAMVTEFGQTNNDTVGLAATRSAVDAFEEARHSWTIWSPQLSNYLLDGGVPGIGYAPSAPPRNWLLEFARPYAPAVAGTVQRERFDTDAAAYELVYDTDGDNSHLAGLPTHVLLPLAHYPRGYSVSIEPLGVASWAREPQADGLDQLAVSLTPHGRWTNGGGAARAHSRRTVTLRVRPQTAGGTGRIGTAIKQDAPDVPLPSTAGLSLRAGRMAIPQVDYEPHLYPGPAGLPKLNLSAVNFSSVVQKQHATVTLTSDALSVTLLPAMGRVLSVLDRATGHETLWRNDVARPGGANNPLGWWLWIGGMEFTLPGQEHGVTWAMEWDWEVAEQSSSRVAVRANVTEPLSGLTESLVWSLEAGRPGALRSDVTLHNPSNWDAAYAHWTNPQMTPGGRNELTDGTELIIPTRRVTVPERWQANLGPSPQVWNKSALRNVRGWRGMGDIMADDLDLPVYAAFAPDVGTGGEGVARVFDPHATPGLDAWTYGFHPGAGVVPTANVSGRPSRGYVEMWGGTVKTFPDERSVLPPNGTLAWSEHLQPFSGTGGLSYADGRIAAYACLSSGGAKARISVHAAGGLASPNVQLLWRKAAGRAAESVPAAPRAALRASPPPGPRGLFESGDISFSMLDRDRARLTAVVYEGEVFAGEEVARFPVGNLRACR